MEDRLRRDCLRRRALASLLTPSRCLPEHLSNPFNNGIDIAQHFEIPKSQHAISTTIRHMVEFPLFRLWWHHQIPTNKRERSSVAVFHRR